MFLPLHDTAPLRAIRFQVVTAALVLLNVVIFLFTHYGVSTARAAMIPLSFGAIPAVLTDQARLSAALQVVPEGATLLTYMFLHGGWMHLIGNMAFLWVFADNVEDGFGHFGFILFYLLCGLAAAALHVFMAPASQAPLIGASGAVAGVLAAYLLLFPSSRVLILLFMRIPLRLSAFWVLGGWIAWQAGAIALGGKGSGVAWWAHVGGFAAGAALTIALRPYILRRMRGHGRSGGH